MCEQFSNGRFIGTYVEGKLVCIFALSSDIEKVARKIGFTAEGFFSYFYPERVHGGGGKYKKD